MVFKRKESFFLDLGSEGAKPAAVAVAEPAPRQAVDQAKVPVKAVTAAPAPVAEPPRAPQPSVPQLTTAEAIAAELRAAQEARPAPSLSTFAPAALNPGSGLLPRRRRAGANLAGFKAMAASMTGK
jgi:hypothetical protein